MHTGSRRRSRRRRAPEDDPYDNFYSTFYGLDEDGAFDDRGAGPEAVSKHRASRRRPGGALLAGLASMLRRRVAVILVFGLVAVGIVAIGVTVSATRTGTEPTISPSLVDTSREPGDGNGVAAGSKTASGNASSSSPAGPGVVAPQPGIGAGPVDTPSTSGAQPSATRSPQPTSSGSHGSPTRPAPSSTSKPPTSSKPPSTSVPPTSQTPTPTPSKSCLVPNPLDPDKCVLNEP